MANVAKQQAFLRAQIKKTSPREVAEKIGVEVPTMLRFLAGSKVYGPTLERIGGYVSSGGRKQPAPKPDGRKTNGRKAAPLRTATKKVSAKKKAKTVKRTAKPKVEAATSKRPKRGKPSQRLTKKRTPKTAETSAPAEAPVAAAE